MTPRHHRFLSFYLERHLCAIPIASVREINQLSEFIQDPVEFLPRVFKVRDSVIPLVDLREHFGLEQKFPNPGSRVVVLECVTGQVGLHVDSVHRIIDFGSNPSATAFKSNTEKSMFMNLEVATMKEMVIVIDILCCLAAPQSVVAESFHALLRSSSTKVS